MTSAVKQDQLQQRMDRGRLIRVLLAVPVYFALFMFLPAGTWEWLKGWVFILVFVSSMAIVSVYLWRVNPEVVVARATSHEGTKRWDKILVSLLLLAVYAIVPVAALDDERFHWLPLPWWVCVIGYGLFFSGMVLVTWAESVNKFFEVTVRLQTDRGQMVIDTGPYAIVRHPGYVSGILIAVGTALCLASVWALIPAGLATVLFIVRTRWEDQTLQSELPGYTEYTQRVRSKLIPGVW